MSQDTYLRSPLFHTHLLDRAQRYRNLNMPQAAERFDEAAAAVALRLTPQPDLFEATP